MSQSASVSQSQKDVLENLGVFARDANDEVLRQGLIGRSIYTDYNDVNEQTRRQEVTAQRLNDETVQVVVDVAQRLLFGATDEAGEVQDIERPLFRLRNALNVAVDDWAETEQPETWDADALLSFIVDSGEEHRDALAALQALDEVRSQVDLIGLSPGELRDQRVVLLSQLRPVRLKLRQFEELFELARTDDQIPSVAMFDDITPQG